MPPPPSLPLLLLPFSSPVIHTPNPHPASASRLHAPRKSLALSPFPRPLASSSSSSSSSSFAVAAAFNEDYDDEDEDVVLGDCLVFEDEAFEDPALDLGRPSPRRRPGRKPAGGGGGLVPERWRDAVEEINLTKKEKRRIAHGLRFGSRLDRRVPSAVAAPDELRAYREGRLDAELTRDYVEPLEEKSRARREAVRLDTNPGNVYRDYVEPLEDKSRAPEMVEAPPPPDPAARVAPRNPRVAMDAGGLEDIAELFGSKEYVPGETEDGKSPRSRRKLFTDEEKALLNKRLPDLEAAASSKRAATDRLITEMATVYCAADPNLIHGATRLQFVVEKRGGGSASIEICCATSPGVLLSTMSTLEVLGLEIEQCVASCFGDFGMQASCSQEEGKKQVISTDEIKQALYRSAGYGGRCL